MNPDLAGALARLQGALGQLDLAVGRHFDAGTRQNDLEIELGVMQEDRARLAAELERASARLAQVEATSDFVGRRVRLAVATIQTVIARSDAPAALGRS